MVDDDEAPAPDFQDPQEFPLEFNAEAADAGSSAAESPDAGKLATSFASLPGTLTFEILSRTKGQTVSQAANEFETFIENMDAITHKTEILSRVLGTDDITCFLTVLPPSQKVVAIHSLSRYNVTIGIGDELEGKVFGRMGDIEDEQFPSYLMMPGNTISEVAGKLFKAQSYKRVKEDQWAAALAAREDDRTLSAFAGNLEPNAPLTDKITIPAMMYLPTAWAPYFLEPLHAYNVYERLKVLMEEGTPDDRATLRVLLEWVMLAGTRADSTGALASKSRLLLDWHHIAPTRRLRKWGTKVIRNHVPRILPEGTGSNLSQERMVAATMQTIQGLNQNLLGQPDRSKKSYTEGEKSLIRAACSLNEGSPIPLCLEELIKEGRTTAGVTRVLQKRLRPRIDSDNPTRIFLSADLVKDIKDLNFAFDGEVDFEDCHRGLSPFAVPYSALAKNKKAKKRLEVLKEATSTTPADVSDAKDIKVLPPHNYESLLRVLANYDRLLEVVVGATSRHRLEILQMRRHLRAQAHEYETISKEDVLQLMWSVLHDSRKFFGAANAWEPGEPLPRSKLQYVNEFLEMGKIMESVHCPINLFYPGESGYLPLPPPPRTGGQDGVQGGLFPDATGSGGIYKGPYWAPLHPLIAEATKGLLQEFPTLSIGALMSSCDPPLKYSDLRLGARGTCMQLNGLGSCSDPSCTYSHVIAKPTDAKAKAVAANLAKAAASYRKDPTPKYANKRKREQSS